MAKATRRAKRAPATPFDDPEYRARAAAADEAAVRRCGMVLHIRLQMLHKAETLARTIGVEGIAEQRLDLARDDSDFRSFLDQVLGGRRASLPR
jgi:hypothetical protein